MLKAILMCLALVAGGVLVTGCSDDSKKSDSSSTKCEACAKLGDGKMCDACQAKMWKDTCPECKKLGQGHMCAECQKKACEKMK